MADILEIEHQFYPLGSTPLHLAANNNDTKTLSQLLHSYYNIHDRIDLLDGNGRTPLVVALQNGRMEAAVLLIQAGANLKMLYSENVTIMEALSKNCFLPVVNRLVELSFVDCLNSNLVAALLASLAYRCSKTELRKMECILTAFPNLIDVKDNLECTPLHYAVTAGNLDTIALFLKFSPNLEVKNPYGNTVLHIACKKGQLAVVETIINHAKDVHSLLKLQNLLEQTPLHAAMYAKQLAIVEYIIRNYRESLDFSLRDTEGHTIATLLFNLRFNFRLDLEKTLSIPCLSVDEATWLLHECVWCQNITGVVFCLSQGAIVNSFDFMQQAPLLIASQLGNVEVCRALVEGGAIPNVYDESYKTPLHYACKRRWEDVFKYLLSMDDIDLNLFYQTYDDPLTLGQIENLLNYYKFSPSPQLPERWLDWLALAASNELITSDTFSAFAQEICPSNMAPVVTQIHTQEYELVPPTKICLDEALHISFPLLALFTRSGHSYRDDKCQSFSEIRKHARSLTPPKFPSFEFQSFIKQTKPKVFPRKLQYFGPRYYLSLCQGDSLISFLHCLLVYKNFQVFEWTLTDALRVFPDCVESMFPQGLKHQSNGQLLLDMIGQHFEQLESFLTSLSIVGLIKSRLIECRPHDYGSEKQAEDFCLTKAVLLYLFSGSIHYHRQFRAKIVFRKPFLSWPLWYIKLRCTWFFQSLGWKDPVDVSTDQDREKLASFLLGHCENSLLNTESSILDPSLLLGAVTSNCVWGVQLLLKHGASPVIASKKKYPLVEAVKKFQQPIISAIIEVCSPELNLTDDFISALCSSLPALAIYSKVDLIKKILTAFSLQESKQMWLLGFSGTVRLLSILLYSPSQECVELGKKLLSDVMCFLCSCIVDNERLGAHEKFCQKMRSYLLRLKTVLKGAQKVHKQFLEDSILFTSFYLKYVIARENLLVTACSSRLHQIVDFILNHISPSDLDILINSLSDKLFYTAAKFGDYDTIKILFEAGFKLTSFIKPPLYAYIDYLFQLRLTCPHSASICHSSQCTFHGSTALSKQDTIVEILLPSREYLMNILENSPKFPYFRLAEILTLQVAKSIFIDLISIYKSNPSLASHVKWNSIIFALASKVRYQSVQDWASVLDEQLVELLLNDNVQFDGRTCVMAARANLWNVCSYAIKKCSATFKDNWMLHILRLAIKHTQLNFLKELYARNDRVCDWLHTNALKMIKVAALDRKIGIVTFLLNKLNANFEGALAKILMFGDEACFNAAVECVVSSHPSIVKENIQMLLTAAAKYNKSSQVEKIMAMLNFQDLSDDEQLEISLTILTAAVKCGHLGIALFALKYLSVEQLTIRECFHHILYWSCYWGMFELLQRLQFTSAQLLHRQTEHSLSPWECALVNGHIGKLSYLSNAPTLDEVWMESFALENGKPVRFEPQHMLTGSFKELMHSNESIIDEIEASKIICFNDHFSRLTVSMITHQTSRAFIKCFGRYTGQILRSTKLLELGKANDKAFELLLDEMARTNDLHKYFDEVGKQNCEYFIEIVLCRSVRRVKALVDRGIDILKYDNDCHSRLSGSLLHAAVQTKNPEMVNFVLSLYGNAVFDACAKVNRPLDIAFALGAAEVLKQTTLATITNVESYLQWNQIPRGWFHLMITENESVQSNTNAEIRSNFNFDIRKVPINELMVNAMKYKNMRVVTSIVSATGNISWGEPYNAAYLSVESDLYQGDQFLMQLKKGELSKFITNVVKRCNNDEEVLRLIKYIDFSSVKILSIFHSSCHLYRYGVVRQLLDDRTCNEVVMLALSTKHVLEEAFLLAIASGNYNTAVNLSLESGLTFESIDSETYPFSQFIPKLSKLIFSQVSYYSVLENFYKSLCECESTFSLAASWLAHNWTQEESQLIVKQLGNTSYAPSNPWLLKLSTKSSFQREILATIDWDSFSECLITSPSPVLQDKHRYTPMLVEAIVFSPVVLGQVCGHTGSNRMYECLSFLPFLDQVSTMIITAQVWPAIPSFNLYGDQATLTLSYTSSNGAFMFPTVSEQESNATQDSGIQSFETSTISEEIFDYMTDLCLSFKNKLKKVLRQRIPVSVSCDPGLTFADHGVFVRQALNDCVSALSLVQNPHVLYANVHPEVKSKNVESFNKRSTVLSKIEVHFVFSSSFGDDHSTCVSVNKSDTVLKISIFISPPTFNDSLEEDQGYPNANFFFESLIKQLVESLLVFEKESCISHVKNSIQKQILPNLSQSLKIGRLDEDFVSFGVQDSNDSVYRLRDSNNFSLSQAKNLIKMTTVVNTFSKLISVVTVRQKLARALFECGFKVLLTEREPTSFAVKGRVSILKLSASDLLAKSQNEIMVTIFSSLWSAISKPEQNVVNLIQPCIPAPFRCFVDIPRSPGFLFPCKAVSNTIVVQLVNYVGTPITTLPTNQCILVVEIEDCNSNQIKASSSTDPHFKTASKHLLINLKPEGIFNILWTPQTQGLHKISIKLNGTSIVNSPFKAYCSSPDARPGYRQTIAGKPLIFITSHSEHRCQKTAFPPLRVPSNKHSIRTRCLNTLQPLLLASRVNSEVEPATGCVQKLHSTTPLETSSELSLCDETRVHHISVAQTHGGISQWIRKQNNNTIVFVSPSINQDDGTQRMLRFLNFSCTALSNGRSMVTLKGSTACTFKLYAACASCHTVLTTHWEHYATANPTPCYITPGSFSARTSVVSHSHKKISKSKSDFEVTAGQLIEVKIKAYDKYGNAHSSGGGITRADIELVERLYHPDVHYPSDQVRLVGHPVTCEVQDNNDGTYKISATVNVAGKYDLIVNKDEHLNCYFNVISGSPCGANFQLLSSNDYEVNVGTSQRCNITMYDSFGNPCQAKNWLSHLQVKIESLVSPFTVEILSHEQYLPKNVFLVKVHAKVMGPLQVTVLFDNEQLPFCPLKFTVLQERFEIRVSRLRSYITSLYRRTHTPTFTVHRDNLLESSMNILMLHPEYFKQRFHVRFGSEPGVDAGGIAKEFFQLLSQQLVDPQYALFQNINGFYKPNLSSSVNSNHLIVFGFFGKILGRAISDGHQIPVRFTPSVYKSLLNQECSLDDLKVEDPTLHMSLLTILNCEDEETLQELAVTFTASQSHFGALLTVELEEGGGSKHVTMANKEEFVDTLCNWHLQKCINEQLVAMKDGLNHVIRHSALSPFSAHELETIMSGQSEVDVKFIRSRTTYELYSHDHSVVKWFWEVLEGFSQEQRSKFLQFSTGSSCLPTADTGSWNFKVQKAFTDPDSLPKAATCFNSLSFPAYQSKEKLQEKLELAILYGQNAFLLN